MIPLNLIPTPAHTTVHSLPQFTVFLTVRLIYMKLSIVIVNYNVKYFLEQCLLSVFKALKEIEADVWVVDNNSVDGSVEMVKQKFPQVKIIANQQNTGFSVANNQAIHASTGEYVLLLNPDTVVEEDTFEKCIRFMDEHPEAGALGARMIDGEGKFLPESKRGLPTPEVALYKMFGLNKLFPHSKKFGKYHLGYLPEMETAEVDVLAGAFMFMRRETLNKVGLLDEAFFMYGEDIDLSYRITLGGYKNYYFPETTIIHYKGESTKKQTVNYVFIFYNAMILFARKHYKNNHAGALIFLIQMAIYLRAGLAVVQRFFSRTWLMLADAAFIFSGMYALKSYWEEHIKLIVKYPAELMTIHVPYYTLLWISSVYLSGGYEKPYAFRRVFRGIAIGTVLILAVYGLFPNDLRFSRALIILGAGIALFGMMFFRMLVHFKKTGSLQLSEDGGLETIVVANEKERKRIREILTTSSFKPEIIGYVSTEKGHPSDEGFLGELSNLDEIVTIYKAKQIIFCSADIASKDIIYWMHRIGNKEILYKIIPEESLFIIGSHSKNTSGELFTEEIEMALLKPYNIRKKRLFDLLVCLILLPVSPVLMFFQHKPLRFLSHIFQVMSGKKTWVSYAESPNASLLPNLKPGVISTIADLKNNACDGAITDRINYLYARNYSIEKDLNLIFSDFNNL